MNNFQDAILSVFLENKNQVVTLTQLTAEASDIASRAMADYAHEMINKQSGIAIAERAFAIAEEMGLKK